jgi:hypothetical protein
MLVHGPPDLGRDATVVRSRDGEQLSSDLGLDVYVKLDSARSCIPVHKEHLERQTAAVLSVAETLYRFLYPTEVT